MTSRWRTPSGRLHNSCAIMSRSMITNTQLQIVQPFRPIVVQPLAVTQLRNPPSTWARKARISASCYSIYSTRPYHGAGAPFHLSQTYSHASLAAAPTCNTHRTHPLLAAPVTRPKCNTSTGALTSSSSSSNSGGGSASGSSSITTSSISTSGGPSPTSSSAPALEDWLRSHGATVNGVVLRFVILPFGAVDRTLVATQDHPAGTTLIAVPRQLQIRYDNIEEAAAVAGGSATACPPPSSHPACSDHDDSSSTSTSSTSNASSTSSTSSTSNTSSSSDSFTIPPSDAAAVSALFSLMPPGSDTGAPAWQLKQAITLLYHLSRGSHSPLAPYLSYLPGLAAGVPTPRVAMLMSDDAVQETQYGLLIQDVRNQKYWLRHVVRDVLGRLSDGGGGGEGRIAAFGGRAVDEGLMGWAVAVAMSRCFGLSRFRTHTCVPLVDMANHVALRDASNCEIHAGSEGEVVMTAKRQIQAGEELTLTYGSHDNHNLLLSYGFTLQPNPNDAFYFDLDLATVESLAEGVGLPASCLAPWQRALLADKLGLRDGGGSGDGDDDGRVGGDVEAANEAASSGTSVQVYLSAVAPTQSSPLSSSYDMGGTARRVVRQPVDPVLLAALRIATLQDPAWFAELSHMNAEQLGDWRVLLARQQEITLMRLLASLLTALYTTFPTTIQQDRQLLAAISRDATTTTTTTSISTSVTTVTSSSIAVPDPAITTTSATHHALLEWPLRPIECPSTTTAAPNTQGGAPPHSLSLEDDDGATTTAVDPTAAVAAGPHHLNNPSDLQEAFRFRLGLKVCLEQCLKAVIARAKELDALQTVR